MIHIIILRVGEPYVNDFSKAQGRGPGIFPLLGLSLKKAGITTLCVLSVLCGEG
jgi:hypothetical protein